MSASTAVDLGWGRLGKGGAAQVTDTGVWSSYRISGECQSSVSISEDPGLSLGRGWTAGNNVPQIPGQSWERSSQPQAGKSSWAVGSESQRATFLPLLASGWPSPPRAESRWAGPQGRPEGRGGCPGTVERLTGSLTPNALCRDGAHQQRRGQQRRQRRQRGRPGSRCPGRQLTGRRRWGRRGPGPRGPGLGRGLGGAWGLLRFWGLLCRQRGRQQQLRPHLAKLLPEPAVPPQILNGAPQVSPDPFTCPHTPALRALLHIPVGPFPNAASDLSRRLGS